MQRSHKFSGVRAIALMEATKGFLVLLAGFGLLSLLHRDIEKLAIHLIGWLHLDPAKRYSHAFLKAAESIDDARLLTVASFLLLYSAMRLIEACGLWYERRWAEWFAFLSGGVYLPFEIYELSRSVTWMKLTAFAVNIAIVIYLGYALRHPKVAVSPVVV